MILTYKQPRIQPIVKKTLRKPRKKKLYDHPRQASKSVRILDMIEAVGPVGMSTTQIRKALWAMTYPDEPADMKNIRGYWSTNLTGSNVRHGLLTFFCTKKGRRWIRNTVPHENSPWMVMDKHNGYKHRSKSGWSNWNGGWNQQVGGYVMNYVATTQVNLP